MDYTDGATPSGTSAYEKRGIAVKVPVWNADDCIECNFCSMEYPHAVIRPVVLDEKQLKSAPKGMVTKALNGMDNYKFAIIFSTYDCTGCGVCVEANPGKRGEKLYIWKILNRTKVHKNILILVHIYLLKMMLEHFKEKTVKGYQFKKSILEFSGVCGGCDETPYAKLITQLFIDRMYIANATGCSSIWGNSSKLLHILKIYSVEVQHGTIRYLKIMQSLDMECYLDKML